jgi:hypothetical protein
MGLEVGGFEVLGVIGVCVCVWMGGFLVLRGLYIS